MNPVSAGADSIGHTRNATAGVRVRRSGMMSAGPALIGR